MQLILATIPLEPEIWGEAKVYLEKAIDKTRCDEWNVDEVRHWVNADEGVLLLGLDGAEIRAAAVVEINTYHQSMSLEIHLMGADRDSAWGELFPELMDTAKRMGCHKIVVKGRRWKRFLEKFGETKETYLTELEL